MTRQSGDHIDVRSASAHADPMMQGLAAKVAFLRRPDSYPEPTARVDAVEAHMSWVFLTDRYAYKLKKPFRRNGIDYSTAALRRLNCRRELRLNQHLGAGVYRGVVALTMGADGKLALGGKGQPSDWLVRMRRLPSALTLERRLQERAASADDARAIVDLLAPFLADARRDPISPAGYRRRLRRVIVDTAAILGRPAYRLPPEPVAAVAGALHEFLDRRGALVEARARAGRIVEGHGDLRPEHIYLTHPPKIMDRIEFARRLRLRDPVEELAFLAMECDRGGCPQFDGWLFAAYEQLVGDRPPRALIDYYKGHSAFIRGSIAIWHLDDPETGPRQHWVDRANDYLEHAARYLALTGSSALDPRLKG